ncbi:hypothetical protein TNCV_5028851 [Trichonephila clavipes]|nr:hypothetical protein TNCV_5028851 [Trichonephila clavipes]
MKRNMKIAGSNKINGNCPSKMKVYEDIESKVTVEFTKTHIGHGKRLPRASYDEKEGASTSYRHPIRERQAAVYPSTLIREEAVYPSTLLKIGRGKKTSRASYTMRRREHLRHIDIQSENGKQLYTPQHLSKKKQYTPQLFSRKPIVTRDARGCYT